MVLPTLKATPDLSLWALSLRAPVSPRCTSPSWQHKLQLPCNLFSLFRSIQHRHWPRLGTHLCTHEWSWPTSRHIILATWSCELYLLLAAEQKQACVCTWGLTNAHSLHRQGMKGIVLLFAIIILPSPTHGMPWLLKYLWWPPLQGRHCWPAEVVSTVGTSMVNIFQGAQGNPK